MGRESIAKASKKLSWLLRHGAEEAGVAMDAAGWVAVSDALKVVKIGRAELDLVIAENNKSRIEIAGDRIRACQGHSREGMPVTLEALEASWDLYEGRESIWHGTHVAAARSIGREGILPGERTHVHLADGTESRVGKRANVDLLIEVSPDRLRAAGFPIYRSSNGVLLCRRVPPEAFIGLAPVSSAAKSAEERLREELGLHRGRAGG